MSQMAIKLPNMKKLIIVLLFMVTNTFQLKAQQYVQWKADTVYECEYNQKYQNHESKFKTGVDATLTFMENDSVYKFVIDINNYELLDMYKYYAKEIEVPFEKLLTHVNYEFKCGYRFISYFNFCNSYSNIFF